MMLPRRRQQDGRTNYSAKPCRSTAHTRNPLTATTRFEVSLRTLAQAIVPASALFANREDASMHIDDTANSRELHHVGLGLTEAEARELHDTLQTLLDDPSERHEHVSSSDYQRELTIWLVRA
jgi:hypothetical protein